MNLTYCAIYIKMNLSTKEKFLLRIALFTDSFVPGIGGTENVVLRLATEFSKTDEVLVVAPDYHKPFDDSALPFKVVRSRGLKVSKKRSLGVPRLRQKSEKGA